MYEILRYGNDKSTIFPCGGGGKVSCLPSVVVALKPQCNVDLDLPPPNSWEGRRGEGGRSGNTVPGRSPQGLRSGYEREKKAK